MERKTIIVPEEIDAQVTAYAESKGMSYSKAAGTLIAQGLQLPPPPKTWEEFYQDALDYRTLYMTYTLFEMMKLVVDEAKYDSKATHDVVLVKLGEFKKLTEKRYAEKAGK